MKQWFEPSTPDKVGAGPWLHPAVVEYLGHFDLSNKRVLEHGSGGSTIWFAKLAKEVTSVEANPDWYAEMLRRKTGAKLILWNSQDKLPKLELPYDLLLIDGEPVEDRNLYLKAARRLVKPGGWVVLDNCNRPEYADARTELQRKSEFFITFMAKPGMYLNTEFFRLRGA